MQHQRKGLRAAFATLGGLQRKLSSSPALVASCVSLLGCTNATQLVPLSPAAVRAGATQVEQLGTGNVVDADGDSHEVSRDTLLYGGGTGAAVSVASLIGACRTPGDGTRCLLDDPAVAWQLPTTHRVADSAKITTWGVLTAMTGALVVGNYECFGPGCSTAGQVALGVTDGLVLLTTIAVVELVRNFKFSSSCGPLAPPCMPREELT